MTNAIVIVIIGESILTIVIIIVIIGESIMTIAIVIKPLKIIIFSTLTLLNIIITDIIVVLLNVIIIDMSFIIFTKKSLIRK